VPRHAVPSHAATPIDDDPLPAMEPAEMELAEAAQEPAEAGLAPEPAPEPAEAEVANLTTLEAALADPPTLQAELPDLATLQAELAALAADEAPPPPPRTPSQPVAWTPPASIMAPIEDYSEARMFMRELSSLSDDPDRDEQTGVTRRVIPLAEPKPRRRRFWER
jgi:hypothetical protein